MRHRREGRAQAAILKNPLSDIQPVVQRQCTHGGLIILFDKLGAVKVAVCGEPAAYCRPVGQLCAPDLAARLQEHLILMRQRAKGEADLAALEDQVRRAAGAPPPIRAGGHNIPLAAMCCSCHGHDTAGQGNVCVLVSCARAACMRMQTRAQQHSRPLKVLGTLGYAPACMRARRSLP